MRSGTVIDTLSIEVGDVDRNGPAQVRLRVELCGFTFDDVLVKQGESGKLCLIDSDVVDSDNNDVFGELLPRLAGFGLLRDGELADIFGRVFQAAMTAIANSGDEPVYH